MKRMLLVVGTALVAIVLSSCIEEIDNKTIVHPDGSLTRTILITGDSASIANKEFKLRLDSTWSFTTTRKNEKSWVLTAQQTFRDAETMTGALAGEPGKSLSATVHLEKSFRWFFTLYSYTETWKCYRLINAEPREKYLTDADLDMFFKHEVQKEPYTENDSLVLKQKEKSFETWRTRNAFEAYYKEFLKGVEEVGSPRLTVADVGSKKEALFAAAEDSVSTDGKNYRRIEKPFALVLRSPVVAEAFRANAKGFESIAASLEYEESLWTMGNFKVAVTMPGVITATNAKSLEGSTARWEDFLLMSLFRDTNLTVESRSVNWWAVGTTGAVVVLILLYLGVALWRRKDKS